MSQDLDFVSKSGFVYFWRETILELLGGALFLQDFEIPALFS